MSEAVEALAAQMKLENYQTFTLFAVHKVGQRGLGAGRQRRAHPGWLLERWSKQAGWGSCRLTHPFWARC